MEDRHDDLERGDLLDRVHIDRDAATVVHDGNRVVGMDRDLDARACLLYTSTDVHVVLTTRDLRGGAVRQVSRLLALGLGGALRLNGLLVLGRIPILLLGRGHTSHGGDTVALIHACLLYTSRCV